MSSISDIIELYLKRVLSESDSGVVEIKRSELADIFQCVPSQINYVISTRFTIEKGYIVESKRGGGGFIRIRKVPLKPHQSTNYDNLLEQVGHSISQNAAEHIISRFEENKLMTEREATLMRHLISRETLQVPIPFRDQIRARMMRMMVTILYANKGE